jgi:hypothetical protein
MRFPGVIMLREHFRCLPEIIEFSNGLAYNHAILPLRELPADPSWQSVIDVHIPDGYREPGTDTNPPEADYIAVKIAELCPDPRYDSKPSSSSRSSATGRPNSSRRSSPAAWVNRRWNGDASAVATPTTSKATNGTPCSCL